MTETTSAGFRARATRFFQESALSRRWREDVPRVTGPALPDSALCCAAVGPGGYACTLPEGHAGRHEAFGWDVPEPIETWHDAPDSEVDPLDALRRVTCGGGE